MKNMQKIQYFGEKSLFPLKSHIQKKKKKPDKNTKNKEIVEKIRHFHFWCLIPEKKDGHKMHPHIDVGKHQSEERDWLRNDAGMSRATHFLVMTIWDNQGFYCGVLMWLLCPQRMVGHQVLFVCFVFAFAGLFLFRTCMIWFLREDELKKKLWSFFVCVTCEGFVKYFLALRSYCDFVGSIPPLPHLFLFVVFWKCFLLLLKFVVVVVGGNITSSIILLARFNLRVPESQSGNSHSIPNVCCCCFIKTGAYQ